MFKIIDYGYLLKDVIHVLKNDIVKAMKWSVLFWFIPLDQMLLLG